MCTKLWKRIDGYSDYWVSSIGEIYSTKSNKFLKLKVGVNGYIEVCLFNNNDRKYLRVHRLVAQAFIPNPGNKPCIDHINTIRDDNRAENLRWVTPVENSNNKLTKERLSKENNPMWGKHHSKESKAKMSEARKGANNPRARAVRCKELDKVFTTVKEASEATGALLSSICNCCRGRSKTAGGYHWKYVDNL